ncbi:MAG: hybrid sensor histidine kinase/response regulator, partial [Noviherbaspirillum sp.]
NAAKYTPEGKKVMVWLVATEEQVILRLSDTGIGISQELLPTIFELFSQAERTSDRSQGGLGLGLALVKSLVELHSGSVSAVSGGQDAGSEFTIRLPRLENQAAQAPSPDFGTALDMSASVGPLHLLVVDDNVNAAQMLTMFLEAAGSRVSMAHDPADALALATHHAFDAYLLDVGLPGMDGYELARRLRAMPQARTALFIAITGYGQQFDRKTGMQAGFDHYLVKPANPLKILALLSEITAS